MVCIYTFSFYKYTYIFAIFHSALSINFPFCCKIHAVLSVDAIDMSGKHEVDLDTNIWKVRNLPLKTIWDMLTLLLC